MDNLKQSKLDDLIADVDELVEASGQLVKTAVMEHRKREQIKNMALPLLWTQDELYEKKNCFYRNAPARCA